MHPDHIPQDSTLQRLLETQPEAQVSGHLTDAVMDRVYVEVRASRSSQRPLRLARRAALVSTLLAITLIALSLPFPFSQSALASDISHSPLWSSVLIAGSGSVLLWQIDNLLMLFRQKGTSR